MKPIRIIIAEDDPQIAAIQQRFLERIEGIELVGVAHTLQEAMELIEILQPQLILLDIQFPEGSGLDLLVRLRSQQQACDVILVTAAREVATLTTALRNGVFDYILKPLNFSRLESAISKYRDHITKLSILGAIAQSNVDEFINLHQSIGTNNKLAERLPKGIDPLTLESIKNLFAHAEDIYTAEQIGQLIGSGRTTARRYLEYLASQKILVPNISYGTVGRPERRYSLSPTSTHII
jgi:two-component system CitB family response regulator